MKVDIALKIKAKNGILQRFIDDKGWSQSDFARHVGCSANVVGRWFNMQDYPHDELTMLEVVRLIGKTAEEIFPHLLRDKDWQTGARRWVIYHEVNFETLPFHEMKELPGPEMDFDSFELKDKLRDALSTLSVREREIIRIRFGLDGTGTATLEDIASMFGVTRERIRNIEQKALWKLKRPSRNKELLREFYGEEDGVRRGGQLEAQERKT